MSVAMTYPFESMALARSHSGRGTISGKRLRSPAALRGNVRLLTKAMSSNRGADNVPVAARMARASDAPAARR